MEQVAVDGFNVPPASPGSERGGPPPAHQQAPGFVPPAPAPAPAAPAPAGLTAEQVAEQIAAAMPKPAPQAPAANQFDFAEDMGNDPILSSLTTAFTSVGAGIDMNRALGNALSLGRADLIDMAYITEKGGAQAAALLQIAKGIVDRVQSQTNAATESVYAAAGGEAQWSAAAAAFNQAAPAHLKTVIAGLLDSGNPVAIKQAAQAVVDYSKQNGLVVNPAQLVHAGASGLSAASALSKAAFQTEHAKLDPQSRTFEADRNALFARRSLGAAQGI